MKAEIAKIRYLPLPRWTAVIIGLVVIVLGVVLLVISAQKPENYVTIPHSSVGEITQYASLIFGVWIATLEFSSGTMQQTLTAEPDRTRVLRNKLIVVLAVTLLGGLLVAAATGGLTHLAATRHHVHIDNGELAGSLFGSVPSWMAGAVVGFGAGLLTRSLGGGIAVGFVFVLALAGVVSFIPPLAHLSYSELTSNLTNGIGGFGEPHNGLGVSILGTVIWCLILVVPGWIMFLRGDLK